MLKVSKKEQAQGLKQVDVKETGMSLQFMVKRKLFGELESKI